MKERWMRVRNGAIGCLGMLVAGCTGPAKIEVPKEPTVLAAPALPADSTPACQQAASAPPVAQAPASSADVAAPTALPLRGRELPSGPAADLLGRAYQAASRLEHDGSLTVSAQWCESLTHTTDVQGCHVGSTALGRAVTIIMSHNCSESCDLSAWYATSDRALSPLAGVASEHVIVTPDLKTAIYDTWSMTDAGRYQVQLHHLRLGAGAATSTAGHACYAPTLSPSGRWIVCRDVVGDVVRFPVEGGAASTVYDTAAEVYANPHEGPYLAPVTWKSDGAIEILTVDASSGEASIETATWTD